MAAAGPMAAAASQAAAGPLAPPPGFRVVDGIDVSLWQGGIDWQQVVARPTTQGQQIQFAFIKASDKDRNGNNVVDPRFSDNWRNSRGLLPRGAYQFFYATGDPEAQAATFIDTVKAAMGEAGEQVELPPVVDVESKLPPGVTFEQAKAELRTILTLIEQAFGVRPIIYTGLGAWQKFTGNTTDFSEYPLWVATYGPSNADGAWDPPSWPPFMPAAWSEFTIWQTAGQKGVAGIAGTVDRNVIWLPEGKTVVEFLNPSGAQPQPPEDLRTALVERAKAEERLPLMLDAWLLKQMVADGFAPNSPEFSIQLTLQRAEQPDGDQVRVYFVPFGEGGQVSFVARSGSQQDALRDLVLAAAESQLVLHFNKKAGLQRRIHDDGYVPISDEFSLQATGASYAAQAAEHPSTGQKRVYYAQAPNWSFVQFFEY